MLFRFSTSRQTLTWIPDSFFTRSVIKSIDFCQDRSIVFILFNHVHMSDSACLRNIYFLRSRAYLIVSIFFFNSFKTICKILLGYLCYTNWVLLFLYSSLLSGRISSHRDETGAVCYFLCISNLSQHIMKIVSFTTYFYLSKH